MQKGKTLWQMWTQRWRRFEFYNPMQAKVGSIVSIDDVELAGGDFAVVGIEEFTRRIEGQEFKFTDYLVRDRGKTEVMRIRINPTDPSATGVPHNVLVLRMEDEFAYSDDFLGVLKDTTRKFVITDDKTGATEEFWRINDVGEAYKCTVAVMKSANADGSVDEDDVVRSGIEYWDYWRETNDKVGLAFKQYVFVQMNSENGWFQIFRGREIDPKNITVV
jgi:hypothetical protein